MNDLGRYRTPFAMSCAAAFVAVCVWIPLVLANAAGPSVAQLTSNVGLAGAALLGALTCALAARRTQGRTRLAWALLASGVACWAAGQVVWSIYEGLGLVPFPSPADIGYLGLPPLVVAALLSLDIGLATSAARIRAVVDGLLIGGSLLVVSWMTVLGRLVADSSGSVGDAISIFYPVGDLVVVTLVAYVLLRRRQAGMATPLYLILVAVGLIAISVADSGFMYLTLTESYASGSFIDTGWLVGFLLIALSGIRSRTSTPAHLTAASASRPLGLFLPYMAVVLGIGAALRETLAAGAHATFGALALGAIVGLVILRQLMTLMENDALTRHLEARVADRTAELQASERRFRALVQRSSDVVLVVQPGGSIAYLSDSIEPVFGYPPDELMGQPIARLIDGAAAAVLEGELALAQKVGSGIRVVELAVRHLSGELRQAEVTITNLLDEPSVAGFVLNTRDVTERNALAKQLVHDAFHDALTGLPNRSLFADRLIQALARRRKNGGVAVIFFDLDGFKVVNDTLGHPVGDRVLVAVAARLRDCVRVGDTVARLGGDEFAVLIEGADIEMVASAVTDHISASLEAPHQVDGRDISLRASAGIAVAGPGEGAEELLRNADLAMYRAKEHQSSSYAFYDPQMHASLVERVALENDLANAVERGEFVLHYQPTFSIPSGEITGVEALIRWNHPERGMVSPLTFIPVAEETGLILDIGAWVLREACRQAVEWQALRPLSMNINLSAAQLRDDRILHQVARCLNEFELPPESIVLEMTESILMDRFEETLALLTRLKEVGVRLAIDDFGTGYSSLSYLHRFPVDVLKIDRSFVEGLAARGTDAAFVRTIVQLGRALGLTTVAEGIEDEAQLAALRAIGCDIGQGFYFSKPLPVADFTEMLRSAPSLHANREGTPTPA